MNQRISMNERISLNLSDFQGRARVKGTDIPASQIIRRLANDERMEDLLAQYPSLTREDILACLDYAATLAEAVDGVAKEIMPMRDLATSLKENPQADTVRVQWNISSELPGVETDGVDDQGQLTYDRRRKTLRCDIDGESRTYGKVTEAIIAAVAEAGGPPESVQEHGCPVVNPGFWERLFRQS